jgi:hypothetical protein
MWWQRKSPDFEWETVAKRGKARMGWETIHRSVEKPWETKSVEFPLPPTNHQRVLQLCPGDWRIAFWRFCQGGPRGSVYLSIYLSAIQFIHLIPINECYIYISTYCRPIESYSKYYYPHISMISQLRGLQGARSADDESTKSAGKRAARAGDLLVV